MATLGDPLGLALGPTIARDLGETLGVYTVGELLGWLPVSWADPPPVATIKRLQMGRPAVVYGRVTQFGRELVEVRGYARRLQIPVATVSDGSGKELCVRFVDERSNPPQLSVGLDVAVQGTPYDASQDRLQPGSSVTKSVARTVGNEIIRGMFGTSRRRRSAAPWHGQLPTRRQPKIVATMDSPQWAVMNRNQPCPIPGINAPTPLYRDTPQMPSHMIHDAILTTLSTVDIPPSMTVAGRGVVDTTALRPVLDGMHRPATMETRAWASQHTGWLHDTLAQFRPTRPAMPAHRLIKTPADAEQLACDVMLALGFVGAVCSPPGRDGGVDVRSREAVAQVKLEGVKTDAPRLQALTGIAAQEGKRALFFSLAGYTSAALAWASQTGMALFEFDYAGGVEGRSRMAQDLLTTGVQQST